MMHLLLIVIYLAFISMALPDSMLGAAWPAVYPCTVHATPLHFGKDRSQSVISIQLASAYTGICLMPPLFGLIAGKIGVFIMHTKMLKLTESN